MSELQEHIKSKIQEASNQVHQETMRGGADVVVVSRRVYEAIEDELDNPDEKFVHFNIVEGDGWAMGLSPCDIRAYSFMGHVEHEVHYPDENESSISNEMAENAAEELDRYGSTEDVKEEFTQLNIPQVEFNYSQEEWTETYEIEIDDSYFQ